MRRYVSHRGKVIVKIPSIICVEGNGGVDAAARTHSNIAGRIKLRNTLPPLASNDLLCRRLRTGVNAVRWQPTFDVNDLHRLTRERQRDAVGTLKRHIERSVRRSVSR